jgi:hypothetical protein
MYMYIGIRQEYRGLNICDTCRVGLVKMCSNRGVPMRCICDMALAASLITPMASMIRSRITRIRQVYRTPIVRIM